MYKIETLLLIAVAGLAAQLVDGGLGMGFGATNSMQQVRLVGAAPAAASASVSLNTSVLYVGQAIGSAIGVSRRWGPARWTGVAAAWTRPSRTARRKSMPTTVARAVPRSPSQAWPPASATRSASAAYTPPCTIP